MVVQHVGMGVARRAAEHERRRAEREADEAEIDLPDEDERVAVAAHEVLATIALDSPHYAPKPQREDKRKRRAAVRGKKSERRFRGAGWGARDGGPDGGAGRCAGHGRAGWRCSGRRRGGGRSARSWIGDGDISK